MRVVAGSARGRAIRTPSGIDTRPTTDRVREAMFNALFSLGAIQDVDVVDLFAGSGALGIEALSRGAASAHFVDADRRACATIKDNLDTLGFRDRARVTCASVDAAWSALGSSSPDGFGLVLADPPYAFDEWPDLLRSVGEHLADDAVVVVESDRTVDLGTGWEKVRERAYGGTVITFVAKPATMQPSDATGVHA